ncbi:armadillo repeat-containing protein 6 homolog [Neocloeon triangulifer]|uniref:armadillo repeat-containing protein 6 homolog n=1 Tax=Neocloeon triangulifer TaxID=2078957 RepID=UPI00286EF391|nr:armadillo repeat-containing protein 6 homolog [Neocloeon triangulifer]
MVPSKTISPLQIYLKIKTNIKMVRVINQETFDSVVKENIEDLDLSPEEAVEDAIKQFKAQGVDLTNIVTSLPDASEEHKIVNLINNLKTMNEATTGDEVDIPKLKDSLQGLKAECDIDIAHKVMAGKAGTYQLLLDLLEKHQEDDSISLLVLAAVTSLMTGQPDLLTERGVQSILNLIKSENEAVKVQALKWARQCCLRHEQNRQLLFEFEIAPLLTEELTSCSSIVARHICAVLRSLILDDDIRVPFGKAHEHARIIASDFNALKSISQLLHTHKGDIETVNELLQTLGALVVREEFCREVEECGGLTFLLEMMITYMDDEKINRQAIKLLKALAGSDAVKAKIVQADAIPLLISAIGRHQSSQQLFLIGVLAIAAISLRSPANSEVLCNFGVAELITQGMKEHLQNVEIQRNCALAVRNIVSRNRELCKEFVDLNIEDLLNLSVQTHGVAVEENIKDALRDLGLKVQLTERWTGTGKGLEQ